MTDTQHANPDMALDALTMLADVAESSAENLNSVKNDLNSMQERRRGGWTWKRIMSSSTTPNPLTSVAQIAANLGRASGEFRRMIIRALRDEGMRFTEIGSLMEVSRQRVSALLHSRRSA